ncbi:hypothetical protein WJX82_001741 [Trebouxia sp. C0006]
MLFSIAQYTRHSLLCCSFSTAALTGAACPQTHIFETAQAGSGPELAHLQGGDFERRQQTSCRFQPWKKI